MEKDAALRRRAIERLAAADTSLVLGEAASVQEALENAATDSWDVIVLDARRPIQIAAQKNEALLEKLSAHFNAPGEHEGSPGADPMREQLRSLSARLLEAREQERAAISRRVHDELGQVLTALQWDVTWLTERLPALGGVDSAEAIARLAGMSDGIDAALQTARKVACELRPPLLDQFGLLTAIQAQAEEFQTRYGVPCEVIASPLPCPPSRCVATAIFRIFQEILTNVARHAGATQVRAKLSEESGALLLVVQDNGRGIAEGRASTSLGILGMHERAWLLGGAISIRTTSGAGTTVEVRIPAGRGVGDDSQAAENRTPIAPPPLPLRPTDFAG